MIDEVDQDDVYTVVERKSRGGSYPTVSDVADKLEIAPSQALQRLGQLRRKGKIEQSEDEDGNGEPVWISRS